MILNKLSLVLTLFVLTISSIDAITVVRGAFDVGSSETKLCVAQVDTETNKILKVYYQNTKRLSLRNELMKSENGELPQSVEDKLLLAINELVTESKSYAPQEFFAVATSVFRTAKNGKVILAHVQEKASIPIHLATQEEEGSLGLHTASFASGQNENDIISWDSGSGSFQITALNQGKCTMYGTEFGFAPAYKILFSMRGIDSLSHNVNPITFDELNELSCRIRSHLPPCPEWLLKRSKEIIAIGGDHSIFSTGQIALEKHCYTKDEVKKAILQFSGKTDQELQSFPKPYEVGVGLTLLYTVMDHCKIDRLTYYPTNGGCEGILLAQNYWQSNTN